jgi:hypothetical protein
MLQRFLFRCSWLFTQCCVNFVGYNSLFSKVSHIIKSIRSSLISSVKFVMNMKNVKNCNLFIPHSFLPFFTWNLSWIWKCMKLQSFHTTLFVPFVTSNLSWIWKCMELQSFHTTLFCAFVPMLGPCMLHEEK